LTPWASYNGIIPKEQAGFRPLHSTVDHLYVLNYLRWKYQSQELYAAFLDLSKAFPSVNRQVLLNSLAELGISKKMLAVLCSMYVGEVFTITTSEGTSNPFDVNHGLKEGSVLSPLLFILLMSTLPARFQQVMEKSKQDLQ
jgi:hypothetical protein